MNFSNIDRTVGYLSLLPFVVLTYYAWCGPLELVESTRNSFALYSAVLLIFMAGVYFSRSLIVSPQSKAVIKAVTLLFGLATLASLTMSSPLMVIAVAGTGHLVLWVIQAQIGSQTVIGRQKIKRPNRYSDYLGRTLGVMTLLICHMAVAVS